MADYRAKAALGMVPGFAGAACRMSLSVEIYVRRGDCGGAEDRFVIAIVVQMRQQFLIAEILCFLKHQPARCKQTIVDGQAYVAAIVGFLLDTKPVLAVPRLWENAYVSKVQHKISCHRLVPF